MRIKICGLFRDEDVEAANRAMPDYAGWVFAPSRRRVSVEWAARARARLDPAITPVGVFVDEAADRVVALLKLGVIDIAQLHGRESEAYIRKIQGETGARVIKAVRVTGPEDVRRQLESRADYLLLDAGAGQGRAFDWRLIGEAGRPFFLAGGIGLENIGRACSLAPFAVDVSSGAETGGLKDAGKILELVRRAHDE